MTRSVRDQILLVLFMMYLNQVHFYSFVFSTPHAIELPAFDWRAYVTPLGAKRGQDACRTGRYQGRPHDTTRVTDILDVSERQGEEISAPSRPSGVTENIKTTPATATEALPVSINSTAALPRVESAPSVYIEVGFPTRNTWTPS